MRRLSSVVIQIQWQRSRIAPTTPARIRTDRIHRQKSCSDSLCNVRYWPTASFRCLAKFGRYWRHSGHWLRLGLDASVANDPNVWSGRALQEDFDELVVSGLAS